MQNYSLLIYVSCLIFHVLHSSAYILSLFLYILSLFVNIPRYPFTVYAYIICYVLFDYLHPGFAPANLKLIFMFIYILNLFIHILVCFNYILDLFILYIFTLPVYIFHLI